MQVGILQVTTCPGRSHMVIWIEWRNRNTRFVIRKRRQVTKLCLPYKVISVKGEEIARFVRLIYDRLSRADSRIFEDAITNANGKRTVAYKISDGWADHQRKHCIYTWRKETQHVFMKGIHTCTAYYVLVTKI